MKLHLIRVGLGPWLRVALALLVVVVAIVDGEAATVLPGTLALVATDVLPSGLASPRARIAVGLVFATLTVGLSVGHTLAALPLLLFTAFRTGELLDARSVMVERLASAAALGLVTGVLTRPFGDGHQSVVPLIQWWTLGLGLGLLAAWANRVQPTDLEATQLAAAREAARLSGRLQTVARDLPLGLDASAVAQTLLDAVFTRIQVDVCAVLLRVDDNTASPLALRGATRLPWRDPIRSTGALHESWTEQRVTVEVRDADQDGRRRGSSLLCVPVTDERRLMIAILVLERRTGHPFGARDIAAVEGAVNWIAPQLEAALHFGELQRSATVFEREQLAREMHNGVAQDLAYVGFGLDSLARAPGLGDEVGGELRSLRAEVTRMLADIRLSIGELRVGIRPDQGLGRVLSTQLQHFGATTGSMVQVELRESTVRLPVDVEHALARLTHELLLDARTGKASSVRVVLDTEPPMATYLVEHDGATAWDSGARLSPGLAKLDATMDVIRPADRDGVAVVVRIGAAETAAQEPLAAMAPASPSALSAATDAVTPVEAAPLPIRPIPNAPTIETPTDRKVNA